MMKTILHFNVTSLDACLFGCQSCMVAGKYPGLRPRIPSLQGRGQGALGHGLLLGRRRRPFRLFGALQSQMSLQGKCAFQRRKVPPKSPSMCLQGKFSWRAPSNDEISLRKVRLMATVWRPPYPCPPPSFAIF